MGIGGAVLLKLLIDNDVSACLSTFSLETTFGRGRGRGLGFTEVVASSIGVENFIKRDVGTEEPAFEELPVAGSG